MEDIKEKLKKLKEQRRMASQANFKEVLEENEKQKRPPNWEKKLERNQKKIQEEEARQRAEMLGQDYELQKGLDMQADELARIERNRANKRKQDPGFIDFEEATKRQYGRLVKQLKQHESSPSNLAIEAGPSSPKIDSQEGVKRMVQSVKQQIEIRGKRSRRRHFNDEADVDYINERNMRFNKKLDRFYGKHTEDIKQNFERGTAL